ncbi:DoxX family protein [Flavobacterium hungaricum]|uniref:DoxX family protein n=1 Tax=Flavobacterium hungaricum TaxID=2082725 RepID=A0ABR9TGK9_9FLAO|nr:DoxX family protein [Flavobacterium hungaricum]MBE8724390.1 DoxX family protein [Flavobacterium hungaricum]
MKEHFLSYMCSNRNLRHFALLCFRAAISFELLIAHGLKKIGIGVTMAETVPNPLGLPEFLNQAFAIVANIIMPLFIAAGLFTKIATLPILAVTLTGYFLVHFQDPIAVKDVPFMYSVCFLYIMIVGPGKFSLDYYLLNK